MSLPKLRSLIQWTIAFTLILNLIFLIKDISDDVQEGAGPWHIGPEIAIVFGTVLVAVLALAQSLKLRSRTEKYELQVQELQKSNLDWQARTKSYTDGLAREIDNQFAAWNLSQAEKEIALLILKGFSNKDIADLRETSESTIKQQSSAIYRKSGQRSRAELSAFFLEDLLAPIP